MDEPELNIDEKAQRQYELVEALVGRMQRISAKSTERLQGCRDDRDCWTDKCSHDISTIEDDIRAEMGRTKKRHKSKFLPSDGGSPTVTWRHARETDKGKQLEETINEGVGHLFADAGTKKWRKPSLAGVGSVGGGDRRARARYAISRQRAPSEAPMLARRERWRA